jgi:hypothetical protein
LLFITGFGLAQSSSVRYVNLSFGGLFAGGVSTLSEAQLETFQGGAHDPKKQGFTVQNLELSLTGAVDPRFYGETHLIFQITPEGESIVEVEEAFLLTQSLPLGLQVKAGTFFTEFGRLNPQHPHVWAFVDQPISNTRLMGGDGLRGPGARISWLTPLPWYSELLVGIQNANGETMFSFLSSDEETEFAGYPFVEHRVRSPRDLLTSGRWMNTVTFGPEITANLGVSILQGPNRTGADNRTSIRGGDFYVKWKPLLNDRGFPFLALQGEFMSRSYEAGPKQKLLRDWGGYFQVLWGFTRGWVLGLRGEAAGGEPHTADDLLRNRRTRGSLNLTWYPSEFSKLRLQYNLDRAEQETSHHSLWLQFEFLMGQHGGHKF